MMPAKARKIATPHLPDRQDQRGLAITLPIRERFIRCRFSCSICSGSANSFLRCAVLAGIHARNARVSNWNCWRNGPSEKQVRGTGTAAAGETTSYESLADRECDRQTTLVLPVGEMRGCNLVSP